MSLLNSLTKRVRAWALYRAAYAELAGLDDRTLADIALTRGDIAVLARRAALSAA